MPVKTKAGLALMVLAAGILGAWNGWIRTRSFVPVDAPVPFAAGQTITSDFKLNFDGLYLIEIEAQKTIPLDELHCLMGVEAEAQRCKSLPAVVAATWVISSEGQDIEHGSSVEHYSAPTQAQGVARAIGEFQGKAGKSYKLRVTFGAGAGALAPARPHLKVAVASIVRTDIQSAKMLVFSTAFICALFGAILLVVAYFAWRGRSAEADFGSGLQPLNSSQRE
jgi:hypothetical protein